MAKSTNMYIAIIEAIFRRHYHSGVTDFEFRREEIIETAQELEIALPKNLGDLIYSFKYRASLPESISSTAPEGKEWVIRSAGTAKYQFSLVGISRIKPNLQLARIKIPDATPGIISKYATSDEQALLAVVRYNRLLDIFCGVTCYSLQSHWRTTAKGIGQIEIDEIYVGVDRHGAHFVFPVQAKGGRDQIGVVQAEQDIAVCQQKFEPLICRPIAAQFLNDREVAMFELGVQDGQIVILSERHYQLVHPSELTAEELHQYRLRSVTDPH